jgi:tripartite ATP-independent transporter DctM subunit
MNPVVPGVVGIAALLIALFAGLPVAFSLGIVGFLGMVYLLCFWVSLPQLHATFFSVASDYNLTVLPFFILMGYFADMSGATADLYVTAEKWLRRLPGGLALATVAGCAGFSAVSGSSGATTATMAAVALPQMRKYKYDDGLATGTLAAGGTMGFLIPPSAAFVIYGIIAEQSVGKLLISGILPGILLSIAFMAIIILRVKINPELAPANPESVSWRERLISLKDVWGVMTVFFLVIGGIYFGIFTPTEGGAAGAFILLVMALVRRRVTLQNLFTSLMRAAGITCMIFLIIFGAFLLKDFLALSQVPTVLGSFVVGLQVSKYVMIAAIILLFLVGGCFIPAIPMIMLLVPIVLPVVEKLGFSPIWFGVISILMVEAGDITPPVGVNVYLMGAMAKDVPLARIFSGALPFLISILALSALLIAFPQIALILPEVMLK